MFWAAVWLAIVLVAIKAYYLGIPPALALADGGNYLRSLAAISYVDVLFARRLWAGSARASSRWLDVGAGRESHRAVVRSHSSPSRAFAAVYAVASVIFFGIFGGFLTYPLLALVGNLRMLSSSVAAQPDAARHPGARRRCRSLTPRWSKRPSASCRPRAAIAPRRGSRSSRSACG